MCQPDCRLKLLLFPWLIFFHSLGQSKVCARVLVSALIVPTHVRLTMQLKWKRLDLLVAKQPKFTETSTPQEG